MCGGKIVVLLRTREVTVHSARGVRNADPYLMGKSDPYVLVTVPSGRKKRLADRTSTQNDTLFPVWNVRSDGRYPGPHSVGTC